MSFKQSLTFASLASVIICTCSSLASAQENAVPEEPIILDPIKITGRGSTEFKKEVPVSVYVMDSLELERSGATDIEQALQKIPGVDLSLSGGFDTPGLRIRGVGSLYSTGRFDNSVVINVDGVSMSSRNMAMGTLDMEQIEVLKGPQGTLYGRNSEAGAINIKTADPTFSFESSAGAELGSSGYNAQEAMISGPLFDNLAGRFAVRREKKDNYYKNARTGGELTEVEDLTYRGSLLWRGSSENSLKFVGERHTANGYADIFDLEPYGEDLKLDVPAGLYDNSKGRIGRESFEYDQDFESFRLTTTVGRSTTNARVARAYGRDLTVALGYGAYTSDVVVNWDHIEEEVYSAEISLGSLEGAEVFWVGGLYMDQSTLDMRSETPAFMNVSDREINQRSISAFGEVTYPVLEKLKVTAGARHTYDRRKYDAHYNNNNVLTQENISLSDAFTTGRLGLSYALNTHTNAYSTWSRGYKPGSFNEYDTSTTGRNDFDGAVIDSYEIGLKTETSNFDLDSAFFFNDVTDDHLLNFHNNISEVVNADTQSYGLELNGRWHINDRFTLSSGVSWTEASIKSAVPNASGGAVYRGAAVPDTPEWSGNLTLDYTQDLPTFFGMNDLVFDGRVDWRYVGDRQGTVQNTVELADYSLTNLRFSVEGGVGRIYAYVDNAFDTRYDLYKYQENGVTYGAEAEGRTFGLGAKIDF